MVRDIKSSGKPAQNSKKYGLDKQAAIKALTHTPAQLVGANKIRRSREGMIYFTCCRSGDA